MAAVIERIDSLEQTVQDFVRSVGAEFRKLYDSQRQTETELRLFKDEMRVFKDEMSDFKDEMSDFKDEMSDFKDEMRDFKDEARRQQREMNKKWGELSNKLGTLVEDLVAPSLPRVIEERLNEPAYDLMVRLKRRLPDGRVKEFDALVVTPDCVCLNSTKATLRSTDVDGFVADIAEFRTFFPEHDALPLVGILASLSVEKNVLAYAEKQGFLVLAVGDELMEVKNQPGFEPKRF
ncbi:hypothetical protein [Candidatus Thiosymbion oneisti]|uniref:hypothetical protein n=1 Tax=Candidatus Thiosymbion oneisti TaxID=589554 RepID=UPI000AFED540|nr:hypothetical protein [Candidatus Thiosymbion oneisti]